MAFPVALRAQGQSYDCLGACKIALKNMDTLWNRYKTKSALRWRHNDHAGVSNHQPHGCLLNRLFRRESKKTSKLRVTGHCAGNSPGTGEFPAQMTSYAENVSIWWRHHARTAQCGKCVKSMGCTYGVMTRTRIPHCWPFLRGIHRWPGIPLTKGQWSGTLMFPLMSDWTNSGTERSLVRWIKMTCYFFFGVTVMEKTDLQKAIVLLLSNVFSAVCIMRCHMASQINGNSIVCSAACSCVQQRKNSEFRISAHVRGIRLWGESAGNLVVSPYKEPVMLKAFPCHDVIAV